MKKFTISCMFGGASAPFTVYIGVPEAKHHPLHFQAEWLTKERGGTIPAGIMDSLTKLKDLADKNGVSFEELCVYALEGTAAPNSVDNKFTKKESEKESEKEKTSV